MVKLIDLHQDGSYLCVTIPFLLDWKEIRTYWCKTFSNSNWVYIWDNWLRTLHSFFHAILSLLFYCPLIFFGRTIMLQNPNERSPPQYCWTINHNIDPGDPTQQNTVGQSKPRGQRVLVLGRSLPTGTSRRAPAGWSESPCFLPHRRRPSRPSLLVFRRPPALATDAEANEIVSGEIVGTVGGVNNECPPVWKPWASESSN